MSLYFYDDSPVYGGHEVMSLSGLRGVLEAAPAGAKVAFGYHPANLRLRERLEALQGEFPALEARAVARPLGRAPWFQQFVRPGLLRALAADLRAAGATRVVVLQGDLESGVGALLAARRLRLPVCSYIAVPHRLTTMGSRLGALREILDIPLLGLPDRWITLSPSMEAILRERGARQPVTLVANGIDLPQGPLPGGAEARAALRLPPDATVIGLLGRTEFSHKGHPTLLAALTRPELQTAHALIGGDGSDQERLRAEIARLGLTDRVHLLGWVRDGALFHAATDVLALPSRFEGVPLVMLEALARERPVVGSDRDGMADLLPPDWRFPVGDSAGLARAVQAALASPPEVLAGLVARVRRENSAAAFRAAFAAACAAF